MMLFACAAVLAFFASGAPQERRARAKPATVAWSPDKTPPLPPPEIPPLDPPPCPEEPVSEAAEAPPTDPPAEEPEPDYAWALLPPFEDELLGTQPPPRRLRDARRFGDYVLREWHGTGCEHEGEKYWWPPGFDILHRGRSVHEESGYMRYEIGSCCSQEIAVGTDVTGDGVPDVVVTRIDGGNRSPHLVRIFELGPELRLIAERAFYPGAEMHDLDGDGVPEIETTDDSLAPWPDWYPGSPSARVVLRLLDGAYVPAPELMRKERSAFADWRQRALAVRDDEVWTKSNEWMDGPCDLWCYACDLVYAGRGDLAEEYLRLAWPRHVPGWDEFRTELRRKIEASPFWPAVSALNGW